MSRLKILLLLIALSQLVLAVLTLFWPAAFFAWMGLQVPAPDNFYMIGMLGARFLAYGLGMIHLARSDAPSVFWIRNMALVQGIDLAVGLFYVATGVLTIGVAAFPMLNAAAFAILLVMWQPRRGASVSSPVPA